VCGEGWLKLKRLLQDFAVFSEIPGIQEILKEIFPKKAFQSPKSKSFL